MLIRLARFLLLAAPLLVGACDKCGDPVKFNAPGFCADEGKPLQ